MRNSSLVQWLIAGLWALCTGSTCLAVPPHSSVPKAAASAKPTILYIVDKQAKMIQAYRVGLDGQPQRLTADGVPCSDDAEDLRITPDHRYLYTLNAFEGSVGAYAIGADGQLSAVGSPLVISQRGTSMDMDGTGKFLYVLAFDAAQHAFLAVVKIGPGGALTLGGQSPISINERTVCADPIAPYVYALTYQGIFCFKVGSDGTPLLLGGGPYGPGAVDMAVEPHGRFLVTTGSDGATMLSILPNGLLHPAGASPYLFGERPWSVVFDPTGRFLYVADGVDQEPAYLYEFRVGLTGALTALGQVALDVEAGPFVMDRATASLFVGEELYAPVIRYRLEPDGTLSREEGSFVSTSGGCAGIGVISGRMPAAVAGTTPGVSHRFLSSSELIPVSTVAIPSSALPAFAYEPDTGSFSISGYRVQANGSLATAGLTVDTGHTPADPVASLLRTAGGGAINPRFLLTDPTGRFLYCLTSRGIAQFQLQASGALNPLVPPLVAGPGGSRSRSGNDRVALMHPSGRFLYVSDPDSQRINQYRRDSQGHLVPLDPATVPAAAGPLLFGPGARTLYTESHGIHIFQISASGALIPLDEPGLDTAAHLVFHPSGRWAYAFVPGGYQSYGVEANGSLRPIPDGLVHVSAVGALTFDKSGHFAFAFLQGTNALVCFQVNTSGVLHVLGPPIPTGFTPTEIVADPRHEVITVCNTGEGTLSQYRIGSTGRLSLIGGDVLDCGFIPIDVVYDPSGHVAYVTDQGNPGEVQTFSIAPDGQFLPIVGSAVPTERMPGQLVLTGHQ